MPSPIFAIDLIKTALRLKGVIATSETPSAEQATDALRALNDVLETWSIESYAVVGTLPETFALVAGQSTYTIGPDGDWDTSRPPTIGGAFVTYQNVDFGLALWTLTEYMGEPIKYLEQPIPQRIVFVNTVPLAQVILYPTPSQAATITINTQGILTQVTDVNSSMILPPGYARALQYALAEEIGPQYGSPIDLSAQARSTLALIKRANRQSPIMTFDSSLTGGNTGAGGGGYAFVGNVPPDQWSETEW